MNVRTRRLLGLSALGLAVFAVTGASIWYFMWRPLRYVDPADGFSIRFSPEWIVQGAGEGANARAARELPASEGGGIGVINVLVSPLENIPDAGAYRTWMMQVNAKSYAKLARAGEGTREGIPWAMFVYELPDKEKTRVQVMQHYFVHRSRGYIISCTARPEDFERFRPEFEEAIDSFRFE